MIRKLMLAASAVALAASGLGLAAANSASAAVTVTAGPGSTLHCSVLASVKLSPALADNWVHADYQSDPDANVRAIPNTTYAKNGPVMVSVKGTANSCTGTLHDVTTPSLTSTVSKISVTLVNDPAHLGSTDPATCIGLFNPTGPSTATYDAVLKYTANAGQPKITTTTITGTVIAGGSFTTSGGVITGSFAGGTSSTAGVPDGGTIGIGAQELLGPAPDGTTVATSTSTPKAGAAPNVCQPAIKIKPGVSATPVKPKGMKGLSIVAGSTLDISR